MLKITIDLGNAAFEDRNEAFEVSAILTDIAERFEYFGPEGMNPFPIIDSNGNRVGRVEFIGEEQS